jgi:ATP-dependent RNA helicase RhlE
MTDHHKPNYNPTFTKNLKMNTFDNFNLSRQLRNAIEDLGFEQPTPIQSETFSVIASGKDVVGVAQTGTGKTLAYMLPILQDLKYSEQLHPRILVLVPTRELVMQVVENIESFTKYMTVRIIGVFGGKNINTQRIAVAQGADIIVATPGRLYDLTVSKDLQLKNVKKLVIDEVDVMLDLGFRFQLTNILELLPDKRQHIMFSATMTEDVDVLIDDFFKSPSKISIALSGTPLHNISQQCYEVENFYTKVNLLSHLISDKDTYQKVLVFVASKRNADRVFDTMEEEFGNELCIIHSNKSQNYRIRSLEQFDEGVNRILIATDVMARGLDLDKITHVINFDTPTFAENYMHRIGRTGRAEQEGNSLLFYTEKEAEHKAAIEQLMDYEIPEADFPDEVDISQELTPEERPNMDGASTYNRTSDIKDARAGFHDKKEKNMKENQGSTYKRKMKAKYKKPKTRGDKGYKPRK